MSTCREFLGSLELALQGLPQPESLIPLSFDEHLIGCEACRELLDAEHALEMLLASLPEPRLPADLASRVLERLRRERRVSAQPARDLDTLLDGAPDPVMPANLASRVLRGVAPLREQLGQEQLQEAALDRLLEKLPTPIAPPNLSRELLAALRTERPVQRLTLLRSPRLWVPLAAAGVLAAVWLSQPWKKDDPAPREDNEVDSQMVDVIDPIDGPIDWLNDEMVDAFEVLENWEHLQGSDLDLLLASIDEIDELLIETSEWDSELASEEDPDESAGG